MNTDVIYSPKVIVESNSADASSRVASMFANSIQANPQLTLGLATGGTPVDVYRDWVSRHRQSQLSFAGVTTFNLDEYIGLDRDHPQSFRSFMEGQLFRHVDIDDSRTHFPSVDRDYDSAIRLAGGIDLQLLGIGTNGHIAFNEPGSPIDSLTREVELTPDTIAANSRYFGAADLVPRTAISMGIGSILAARQIVLLATGESKAKAVSHSLGSPPCASCPASLLQYHPLVTFVLDAEAGSMLAGN